MLRLGMKRSVSPIFGKGRSTPNFWPTLHLLSAQSGRNRLLTLVPHAEAWQAPRRHSKPL